MIYDNVLRENTHFNASDIQCEAVTGYEGNVGIVQSMIESTIQSQEIFEKLIEADFAEVAAKHNIGSYTKAVAESMIFEAEEGDSKGEGIGTKIVNALKTLWSMFTNAIDTAINAIKTYLARDLGKFANNVKLKSDEELAKIKLKKFQRIDISKIAAVEVGTMPAYDTMSKEDLQKEQTTLKDKAFITNLVKKFASSIQCESVKEYRKKIIEGAITEETDVALNTLVKDAKGMLTGGKQMLGLLVDQKKAANKTYKESIDKVNAKKSSVKKTGSYTAKDDSGNETKVTADKDTYALACSCILSYMKKVHELEMTNISVIQELTHKSLSQAKAIMIKASQGTINHESTLEEDQIAEDNALFEACEYDTEIDMDEIIQSGDYEQE